MNSNPKSKIQNPKQIPISNDQNSKSTGKSDVYFIKIDSNSLEERAKALKKLLAEIDDSLRYQKDEILPVKITIGDSQCVYHLSPELIKIVVNSLKKKGTRPFLFDTSVIYTGQRQNAVDHLNLVQSKGFGHTKVGAPFIIADGLFGQDGKDYVIDTKHITKVKVPSFVGMLDSLVVLSHATGHIVAGFAGAIKNVAMGMSARPTKQVQHSSLKPSIIEKKCTGCGCCINICPVKAISSKSNKKAYIASEICMGCGECICACKFDAIYINWDEEHNIFCNRLVEVANFILSKFKNKFFINFVFDVTKECDCISTRGEPLICANIGILASRDILGLERATSDLALENKKSDFLDKVKSQYEAMYDYAAGVGLGNLEYNLVEI